MNEADGPRAQPPPRRERFAAPRWRHHMALQEKRRRGWDPEAPGLSGWVVRHVLLSSAPFARIVAGATLSGALLLAVLALVLTVQDQQFRAVAVPRPGRVVGATVHRSTNEETLRVVYLGGGRSAPAMVGPSTVDVDLNAVDLRPYQIGDRVNLLVDSAHPTQPRPAVGDVNGPGFAWFLLAWFSSLCALAVARATYAEVRARRLIARRGQKRP
jgi:hypothetical protein